MPHTIRGLLERYSAKPGSEAEYRERMLALLDHEAPFARSTFEPGHFTASAFVLSPDRTELLLIEHGSLGLWLQPGGHIETSDKTLVGAALREVLEETGIRHLDDLGLHDIDIHGIPANPRKAEPAHEHFDVRWLFVAHERKAIVGDGVLDVRWVPLNQVCDAGTDDSVLRAVRKIQGGLA